MRFFIRQFGNDFSLLTRFESVSPEFKLGERPHRTLPLRMKIWFYDRTPSIPAEAPASKRVGRSLGRS